MNVQTAAFFQCRRFFPHLLERNRESNLEDVVQSAHVHMLTGMPMERAIDKACQETMRGLGFSRVRDNGKRRWVKRDRCAVLDGRQ